MRTCQQLVLTGEVKVNPWDKSQTFPAREPCGEPAVQHVVIYSEDDVYDDDDQHVYSCADHSEKFTASENVRIFPISN